MRNYSFAIEQPCQQYLKQNLSAFSTSKKILKNPFNTIHWIEKTQQILQNNQETQLYVLYFSICIKKVQLCYRFNYEGGIKEYKNQRKQINPTRYFRAKISGYGFFFFAAFLWISGLCQKKHKKRFFCVRKREGRKARCGYPLKDNIFGWKIWFWIEKLFKGTLMNEWKRKNPQNRTEQRLNGGERKRRRRSKWHLIK